MTKPSLIIGVGGLLASGKDTFADHLVRNHNFVKLGMSDTLAEATRRLSSVYVENFDWDVGDQFVNVATLLDRVGYNDAKKNEGYRLLLQELGTEVGRQLLGENIWVNAARQKILTEHLAGRPVVITGIRFPNEIGMIRELAEEDYPATSVWVKRPGGVISSHASETSVGEGDFEYTLDNSGTIADLWSAGEHLLHAIQKDF